MRTDWNDLKSIHIFVYTENKDKEFKNQWQEIVKQGFISQFWTLDDIPKVDWRKFKKRDLNKLFKISDTFKKKLNETNLQKTI